MTPGAEGPDPKADEAADKCVAPPLGGVTIGGGAGLTYEVPFSMTVYLLALGIILSLQEYCV